VRQPGLANAAGTRHGQQPYVGPGAETHQLPGLLVATEEGRARTQQMTADDVLWNTLAWDGIGEE
jgi:hypothetical protein